MAKKNVFPVCNPDILEFKRENSLEALGNNNIGNHFFHVDGSWGQLLLGEANMEDWGIEGQIDGRGFFNFGSTEKAGYYQQLLGYTSNPPAGLVISIGSKNKQNGTFDDFYTFSRTSFSPSLKFAFTDEGDFDFDTIFDGQQTREEYNGKPKWFTVMWSGKRWVFLGSNNCY